MAFELDTTLIRRPGGSKLEFINKQPVVVYSALNSNKRITVGFVTGLWPGISLHNFRALQKVPP